jgi:hypothetical protein
MNNHTFRLSERRDASLWLLPCEVRFAANLFNAESEQSLEIDAENFAMTLDQVARQLEAARSIAHRPYDESHKL